MKMWSQGRIASVALASLTLASGCFNEGLYLPRDDGGATLGDSTDTEITSSGTASISTVTSDTDASTSGDPSTSGSGSSSTSEGSTSSGDTANDVDTPPVIESFTFNKSPKANTVVVQAGKQAIAAHVVDDHAVTRVEFFLDDDDAPFAVVPVDADDPNPKDTVFEAKLPIYDADFNGDHAVKVIAYDSAEPEQSAESAVIEFTVELPLGGSNVWQGGVDSKFASKALAVAVDSFGDAVVVGWQAVSPDSSRTRMVVRKYDGGDGEVLWERFVPTQFEDPSPEGNNVARGVAIDDHDNVYVVGDLDPGGKSSLWLGKFTTEGLKVDEHVSAAPESRGHAVAVDESRVYVAGYYSKANLNPIGTLSAFDHELGPIWNDTLEGIGAAGNALYGLTLERSSGDIIVVGAMLLDQLRRQGLIVRYKPTGSQTWWRAASPKDLINPIEETYGVAVDDQNRFVCVGRRKVGSDPRRLWILRVDQDGNEDSSIIDNDGRCGGLEQQSADFCGIAVSPSGHELLAGVAPHEGLDDDFLVKKMKGLIMVWTAIFDGYDGLDDRSLGVTTDADGFVIAVGYEFHSGVPRWWVTKYNP